MRSSTGAITSLVQSEYKYGFHTDIETESAPPGSGRGFCFVPPDQRSLAGSEASEETGESSLPAIELFARRADRRRARGG